MTDDPDRCPSAPSISSIIKHSVVPDPTSNAHLHEIFAETVRSMHHYVPLHRAVLVTVGAHYRDLLAVACWSENQAEGSRTLALRLPVEDSLFAHVAAQRFEFSDDYFGLFSGTSIERQLLLDGVNGGSYMICPIKVGGGMVGLIAFSSDLPGAFGDFESLDPNRTFAPLAAELSRLRQEPNRQASVDHP
jgi:GAF domain-containing protein